MKINKCPVSYTKLKTLYLSQDDFCKELSEDELEGEVYDFEVVDFGYDRNKE